MPQPEIQLTARKRVNPGEPRCLIQSDVVRADSAWLLPAQLASMPRVKADSGGGSMSRVLMQQFSLFAYLGDSQPALIDKLEMGESFSRSPMKIWNLQPEYKETSSYLKDLKFLANFSRATLEIGCSSDLMGTNVAGQLQSTSQLGPGDFCSPPCDREIHAGRLADGIRSEAKCHD